MVRIISFILTIGCLTSCYVLYKPIEDKLTLTKQVYSGCQLRIDGYYYYSADNKLYDTYFLYRDGLIINGGGSSSLTPFESFEKEFSSSYTNEYLSNSKYAWGLFNIQGDSILIERWYPSSGGPLPVYMRMGKVLNDTTFVITESYRMKKGKKTEVDSESETYHFRQFSPKPDSTNIFIK